MSSRLSGILPVTADWNKETGFIQPSVAKATSLTVHFLTVAVVLCAILEIMPPVWTYTRSGFSAISKKRDHLLK